jgi:hypothetical protein
VISSNDVGHKKDSARHASDAINTANGCLLQPESFQNWLKSVSVQLCGEHVEVDILCVPRWAGEVL